MDSDYAFGYVEPGIGIEDFGFAAKRRSTNKVFSNITKEDLIDGAVFIASDFCFFRFESPLSLNSFFFTDKNAKTRFKGFPFPSKCSKMLTEIRIGKVHNYTLSFLVAHSDQNIDPRAFSKKAKSALESCIDMASNSSALKIDRNLKISNLHVVIYNEIDFLHIATNWPYQLQLLLGKNCKVYVSLYKFGQSMQSQQFSRCLDWLYLSKLETAILHHATDIEVKNCIMWCLPAEISSRTGFRVTSVYPVGLQPGVGNVRLILPSTQVDSLQPTHITLYTRLWNELHRDRLKLFAGGSLIPRIVRFYCDYLLYGRTKVEDNRCQELLRLLNRVSEVIKLTMNLKSSYPARVEAVWVLNGKNLSTYHSSANLITDIVIMSSLWLHMQGFFDHTIYFIQETKEFSLKNRDWFLHFSGSVKKLAHYLLEYQNNCKDISDGLVSNRMPHMREDILAYTAVEIVLTACYSGNIKCSKIWKDFLEFQRLLTGDLESNRPWVFSNIVQDVQGHFNCIRVINIPYDLKKNINVKASTNIPIFFDILLQNGKRFVKTNQNISVSVPEHTQMDMFCMSFWETFIVYCYFYVKLLNNDVPSNVFFSNSTTVTLKTIYDNISPASCRNCRVISTTEMISILQDPTTPSDRLVFNNFWLLISFVRKFTKNTFHSMLWVRLEKALREIIITFGIPLIIFYSCENGLPIIVVPEFYFDKPFREFEEGRIEGFNESWVIASFLWNGKIKNRNPSVRGGRAVYQFIAALGSRRAKRIQTIDILKIVDASIEARQTENFERFYALTKDLPDVHKNDLLYGNYIHGKYLRAKHLEKPGTHIPDQNKKTLQPSRFEELLKKFKKSTLILEPTFEIDAIYIENLSMCYTGNNFMEMMFVYRAIVNIAVEKKLLGIPNAKLCILRPNLCFLGQDNTWSVQKIYTEEFSLNLRTIIHVMLLKNHYVLFDINVKASGGIIELELTAYDTYQDSAYENLIKRGHELLSVYLQEWCHNTLRKVYEGLSIPVISLRSHSTNRDFVQGDGYNCGSAVIQIAESIFSDLNESGFQPFEDLDDYRWHIVYKILQKSANGRIILDTCDHEKSNVVRFLKEIKN